MSLNTPPDPNVATFNNAYWTSATDNLTKEYADLHYLKFPIAQGTETLASVNVNGTATFKSEILLNDAINATTSKIDQNNKDIEIKSCSESADIDSTISLYTTDGTGASVNQLQVSNTQVIVNPQTYFSSTDAPTSNQTLLDIDDNSNKIPTTEWVKSVLSIVASLTVYNERYTTSGTITTPNNCKYIDIQLIGAGGLAGTIQVQSGISYYGGMGSGGNIITGYGIPMAGLQVLTLAFSTVSGGSSSITYNGVLLARAFNGTQGANGSFVLGDAAGGATNTTVGVGDTSFASFYNTFGSAGSGSTNGGITPPNASGGAGCPKGQSTYASNFGVGQRTELTTIHTGALFITYHIYGNPIP